MYAPIVLFVYDRPAHTRRTLEALAANARARESELFVYADGPKEGATAEELEKIRETRDVVRSGEWCKNVTLVEAEKNKGLATSIVSGVTEIVNRFGQVIVLEDDLVVGKHFLKFMNDALERYRDEKRVFHVCGYRFPVKRADAKKAYFYPVMDCWGWATWADRWSCFKKDPSFCKKTFTEEMIRSFNMDGADPDKWGQIEANLSGKLDTWAIFWGASIFLQHGLCLAPCRSLVQNIGSDDSGEHAQSEDRLLRRPVEINAGKITKFPKKIAIDRWEYLKNRWVRWSSRTTFAAFVGSHLPEFAKIPLRRVLKKRQF